MKRLTREQELKIIQKVYEEDAFMGHGGGRMVFELPEEIAAELDLQGDYIVKIALGEKGLSQNLLETDVYMQYNDTLALADIPYAGQVIEIMERVNVECTDWIYRVLDEYSVDDEDDDVDYDALYADFYDSFYDMLSEEYAEDEINMTVAASELADLAVQLTRINGSTSDNGQIGMNSEGHFVAYDYGFTTRTYTCEQCSDTRDYIGREIHRHTLLNLILENANNDPILFEEDEIEFMSAVERDFFDYIHSYDDDEDICGYEDDEEDTCTSATTDSLRRKYHDFFEHCLNTLRFKDLQDCAENLAATKIDYQTYYKALMTNNTTLSIKTVSYLQPILYRAEEKDLKWKKVLTNRYLYSIF